MNPYDILRGKTAVITGSGRGIGRADRAGTGRSRRKCGGELLPASRAVPSRPRQTLRLREAGLSSSGHM